MFELLPAIDLRGGRVVRLRRGDFSDETAYADAPAVVAARFAAAGATSMHAVDLDGARAGEPRQENAIAEVVAAVAGRVACEVSGGLRTDEAVERALGAGAARVVLGTAVVRDPDFATRLVGRYGSERIVAALDVRGGRAIGDGWRPGAAGRDLDEAFGLLADAGVTRFEVTGIERDGLLAGPDLGLLARLVAAGRGAVVASGGVASVGDLLALRDLGCAGAIVGRALYEGRLDLEEALRALAG